MREPKVCPLFFASGAAEIEVFCRPDRCAWAYGGACAIPCIAHSLSCMNQDGINVYREDER